MHMMERKLNSWRSVFQDLKCDFERYGEYYGFEGKLSMWRKFKILLRSPSVIPIINHRFGYFVNERFRKNKKQPVYIFLKIIYYLGKYLSVCAAKTDILSTARIGPGLFLSPKGNIILGVQQIGKRCTIHHEVTMGMDKNRKLPILGNDIWVGNSTILYGGIKIGDGVVINESTVLSKSIPEKRVAGGNPCRIIKKL